MTNTSAKIALKAMTKVTDKEINEICKTYNLTSQVVKVLWSEVKEERKAAKKAERIEKAKASFELTHNCFYYKGDRITLNVTYVTSINAIVWKGLDKNAVYYAKDKKGALVFGATTTTVSSNEWKKALIQGNKGKCLKALAEITRGLNFDDFLEIAKGFKNFKVVCNGTKAIEAIKEL